MRERDLHLRPFVSADEAALEALFGQPAVKRWWPVADYQRESGWVIEIDGAFAGWLEHHEESYEWFPSVAFDIALDSSLHDGGFGRRALRLAIEHFRSRGHHRFTVDPNVENERAIRCYSGVGFEPAGVLRAYERNPAGGLERRSADGPGHRDPRRVAAGGQRRGADDPGPAARGL